MKYGIPVIIEEVLPIGTRLRVKIEVIESESDITNGGPRGLPFTTSERGFKQMETITDQYLGSVIVYESSVATEPCLWVRIKENPTVLTQPKPGEAAAHLTLDQVRELRDQLNWLIDNHYQVECAQ